MVNAANVKLQGQYLANYRKLPSLERYILQLFSVIYEPVSRATFLECLNKAAFKDEKKKPVYLTVTTLKPYIERLLALNLLTQERGKSPQCQPLLAEIATRDAVSAGYFETLVKAVHAVMPVKERWKGGGRVFLSDRQFLREVRIGIYRQDTAYIGQQFEDHYRYTGKASEQISMAEIYQQVINNPFDQAWFRTLSSDLYTNALSSLLSDSFLHCIPADDAFELLREKCAQKKQPASDFLRLVLAEQLILRGQLSEAQQSLERLSPECGDHQYVFWGWLSFLRGELEEAIAHYSIAIKALKKATGKRQSFFHTAGGIFFILALLEDGSPERLQEAEVYCSVIIKQPQHWLGETYARLRSLIQLQQGDLSQKAALTNGYIASHGSHHSLETLVLSLCLYWTDADKAKKYLPTLLEPLYEQAKASGYNLIAMEAAEVLGQIKPRSSYGEASAQLRQEAEVLPLIDLIQAQEPWELCLNALTNLHQSPASPKKQSDTRLAWLVKVYANSCMIQPREQKMSAKGAWGVGRAIALKRLHDNPGEFDYFIPQDLQVCAQVETYTDYSYSRYYGKTEYCMGDRAILALIGHPFVFWEDAPTTRVEIVRGEPELWVKKGKQEQLTLEFSQAIAAGKNIIVVKETPTRLKVMEIKPEHHRIAEILGAQNRLEVPNSAKERVLAAIHAISGVVTVHSDIGGGVAGAEEVPADTQPHVHLRPAGEGLKVAILARPFAQGGSYYRPGAGGETVIAEIEGRRLQTTRNLQEEKHLANNILSACPTMMNGEEEDGEWMIDDPEDCLELLLELQAIEENIVMEWPEGEKFRVSHQADVNSFRMNIQRQNDWFAASGELTLDDSLVLDMKRLMELLKQTPSRFVPLGNGQFLALTQTFRKRLDELRSLTEQHGNGVRFHPLASLALEDFVDEVGALKADKHWKAHVKRLKEAQELQPQLPSTLQAELRDYQIDGFNWLARLAHWGVGACLADDMGLGKSLQALAIILQRAPAGATLIIAPTSVGMHWTSEAQRFAPTLNVVQLGSGDRQALLDQLQPFDLLICSYGLLQQEDVAEMLAQVQWQTIVLDEAQAIKNTATKRSQAAMKLQGEFKVITTGTPVENHLGELWNLFRFINPGLLGSLERFNQTFAVPIERYQDQEARHRLKKLIQPFLLRRTKNQVLTELPSRTEVLLQVELSQEEVALYEALRQEAIARLSSTDATAGAKHLQVLAEIMKLRRFCCNPQLVMPNMPLMSSKLQLFGEVLEELLANHHKTLVFSQFVDHLQIIQKYLEQLKIPYQYLDGSTSVKERKKRVDAFQAGEGDVFLISLKAGGTGLNLTAADYVIHMDPWWNPAVEDQASDRAHRIGQQRPVTIYRLVAKDTIEEKIVDLHQHKRALADSLLEGADISGKISTEELLRLIQAQ
jgi:superfamily II DNA or RNA helicase